MQTIETKSFLQSRTLWGGALLLLAFALKQFFAVEVTEEETQGLVDTIVSGEYAAIAAALVGFIMVIVGRFKATKPVSIMGGNKPVEMWFIGATLLPALMLVGCTNDASLVNAADQYLNTAGDEYIEYVEADESLDEESKAIRRLHHNTFRRAVDEAKLNQSSGGLF